MSPLLQDLILPHAAAVPPRLAICWKDERIPYAELDRLTTQLGHTLRAHGCRPGERIPVLIPHSPNAVFALLGILKAGGVAVPVDIATPTDQLAKILRECQPPVILASRSARPGIDQLVVSHFLGDHEFAAVSIGTLEGFPLEGEHFSSNFSGIDVLHSSLEPLPSQASSNAPACVFFGPCGCGGWASTARSHPLVVSHAEVLSHVHSTPNELRLSEFDRIGTLPLDCPLAVSDLFAALAAGAEVHVIPYELVSRPQPLLEFVRVHQLTDWRTNDQILCELVRRDLVCDGDLPSLHRLTWTGGSLPPDVFRELKRRLPLTKLAQLATSDSPKFSRHVGLVRRPPDDEPLGVPPVQLDVVPSI